jgi:hypothetical protein
LVKLKVHEKVGVKHKRLDHQHRYHNGVSRKIGWVQNRMTDIELGPSMVTEIPQSFSPGPFAGMVMVFQVED